MYTEVRVDGFIKGCLLTFLVNKNILTFFTNTFMCIFFFFSYIVYGIVANLHNLQIRSYFLVFCYIDVLYISKQKYTYILYKHIHIFFFFCYIVAYLQLNKCKTGPYFLQNFQCTTMFISVYCKICELKTEHEIVFEADVNGVSLKISCKSF